MDLMSERYRFAEVVYYHAKKAAFSAMIAKAIETLAPSSKPVEGLDTGSIYPAPWTENDANPSEARHICHFGDETLLAFLSREAERVGSASAASLVQGILFRSEYRLVFTLDYEAAAEAGGPLKFINRLRTNSDQGRRETEEVLKRLVNRSRFKEELPILLYCPNIRMQAKEVAAHVELTPNKVIPLCFEGEDQQVKGEMRGLNGKYQRLWRLYLFAHPKLVCGEGLESEQSELLDAIVDTFCTPFGVSEPARIYGSRHKFTPFHQRLEAPFEKWLKALDLSFPLNENIATKVRKLAHDRSFWAQVLEPEAPFPVTAEEYEKGFNCALAIAAADSTTKRQREQWPTNLRSLQGSTWYKASSIPNVEVARHEGLAVLAKFAESAGAGAPASARAKNWEEFVDYAAHALSSHA